MAKKTLKDKRGRPLHGLHKNSLWYYVRCYIDYDYFQKLDDKSLLFMNQFNEEYYNNRFYRDGNDFYNTKDEKKPLYQLNSARRKDMYCIAAAYSNRIFSYDDIVSDASYTIEPDDLIDLKKAFQSLTDEERMCIQEYMYNPSKSSTKALKSALKKLYTILEQDETTDSE